MSNTADKLSLLVASPKEEPVSYFKGVVQQTQGSKAYVLIDGGVSLWCDAMDVKALADDRVRVEVRKRKATLIANYSHPVTDDALANDAYGLAQVANNAASDAQVAADDAIEDAGLARQAAEQAASDASSAAQSASEAATSAANAQTSASNAQASAQTAAQSATQAVADAGRAATAAENAEGSAAEASAQATAAAGSASDAASSAATAAGEAERANQMANGALAGLSTLESVIDTVDWFAQHKKASTDTTVNPDKTYYIYDESSGTLSAVDPEGTESPSAEGWYELDETIQNYVATHVAETDDGLYVLSTAAGWRVLVSTGVGDYVAGVFIIDPQGVIRQALTGAGITFSESMPFTIGGTSAFIQFDGNGHISIGGTGVSIAGGVTIGGYNKTLSEVMAALNASISAVEYGVGNSPTSHSDITSWSSASPAWEQGKYVWMRTTTNGLTYTYTCIQGANGKDGDEGSQILGITTAPSSYTTTTGGFTPTYRIALSTVKTQSGATDVRVGDVLAYSYYHYPVGYVDASYVYCGARKSIRGAAGSGVTVSKTEYGTSASASTQPSSWSQTVPTSISQGTWLWVKTTYSDGSDATTKSYVGTDGDDGKSVYVKSADKTGDTTTVVLTDGTNDTTLTITDGTDGQNGTPGTNGLSGYVHTAWANSADGATDFSTTVSANKTYLGVYTDNTQADSTDPTKYSWSLIKGQKGDTGPQGPTGKGVSSITEYYALNNDSANAPSDSSFSTGVKTPTESNKYVWNYELITYTDSSTSKTAKHIAATYGMTGSAGKGITSIVDYYAVNNSTTAPDDGSFSAAVVTPTASNRYLWNYELTTYTDSTTSKTGKRVIGVYGEKGDSAYTYTLTCNPLTVVRAEDGTLSPTSIALSSTRAQGTGNPAAYAGRFKVEKYVNGAWASTAVYTSSSNESSKTVSVPTDAKLTMLRCSLYLAGGTTTMLDQQTVAVLSDGTSVTVTKTEYAYQLSSSGTTVPTGDWSTSPVAPTTSEYAWTRTTTTYSDGNEAVTYTVGGKVGQGGTSVTITSKKVTYQTSTSGTTAPSGSWKETVPAVSQGSYLWTRTEVTYSDGNSTTAYSVGRMGTDGGDAYTVVLSNESHTFPAGVDAADASSTTCSVIAYKGTTRVAATIGTISGQVTGLTTSVSNNGSTSASFTVSAATTLKTKSGTLTVPVTVDGKSFSKSFTWALALKGDKGDTPSITATKSGGTTTIKVDGTTIATVDDGTTPTVTTRTNQDGSTTIVINGSDSATIEKGTDGKSYYTYVRYSANSDGESMVATPTASTKYIGVYTGESSTVPAYTAFTWSKYVGENGTSPDPLRVTSTKTDYQLSTSGTTTPTGNWSETPLAPTTTQYLWTRTTLTFSDGSSSTSYSVGGKAGTSVTVTSTATTYAASTSGTTAPSSGWQNSVPSVAQGSYLWTKVVTTFSDGKTATSLTSSRQGKDGEPGQKGDTGPEAVVTVYPSAINWGAGTATLAVTLRVNGAITTPTSYKWTKGTSATVLKETTTLAVTDLDETYHCTVTW